MPLRCVKCQSLVLRHECVHVLNRNAMLIMGEEMARRAQDIVIPGEMDRRPQPGDVSTRACIQLLTQSHNDRHQMATFGSLRCQYRELLVRAAYVGP